MDIFSKLSGQNKTAQRALGGLLLVALLAAVFIFQKGSSDDSNVGDGKAEWVELKEEKETIHLHWLRTLNSIVKKTDGDMIWNTDLQRGLMRFTMLPLLKNNQYYHLWIYDLHQSTEMPVPAGTFSGTKNTNDEFYVEIKPAIKIAQPLKFLLTIGNKNDTTFSRSQSLLLAQP